MDERMNENAAPCADMRAAETGAESAPKAKKPYVKPTMQVFPLNCQLLAASGPVQVAISGGFSMYNSSMDKYCYERRGDITVDDFLTSPSFSRLTNSGYMFTTPNPTSFTDMCYYSDEHVDKINRVYGYQNVRKAWGPLVQFGPGGEGWSEADFLANVELEGDGVFVSGPLSEEVEKTVSGTHNGVPVKVTFVLNVVPYQG